MEGDGIQKGEGDERKRDADAGTLPSEPKKVEPKTIEEAIRAGDWAAVAKIRLATIASLERNSHEDADGDGRVGDNRSDATAASEGKGYLDAEGRDPQGYKYYANFGYDDKGNYHDSYGNTLDTKTGVATTEKGTIVDLKHGITTKENIILDHVTHQGQLYNPDTGLWYTVQYDENWVAKDFLDKDPKTGEPVGHSKEDAEAWAKKQAESRPPATDEQLKKWEDDDKRVDEIRKSKVHAGKSNETPNPSADTTGQTQPGGHESKQPSLVSAAGDALGGLTGNVIIGRERDAETAVTSGLELFQAHTRQLKANAQRERAVSFRNEQERTSKSSPGAPDGLGPVTGFAPLDNAKFAINGGELDKDGGFLDKDGGYTERMGGYRAPDGSYTDNIGNFVDKNGNLWLADNKTNKADFPKQDGLDYREALKAWREGTFSKWVHDHPQIQGHESQLQNALIKVDAEWDRRGTANTSENRAYAGQKSMLGNFVDKQGNLWLAGSIEPIAQHDGADYIDLLKKAEQGKLDEWKATGDLTPDEVIAIKKRVVSILESKLSELGFTQKLDEMSEIVDAAKAGRRVEEIKERPAVKLDAESRKNIDDFERAYKTQQAAIKASPELAKIAEANMNNLQKQAAEMAEISTEAREAASKSKFAPKEKVGPAQTVVTVSSFGSVATDITPATTTSSFAIDIGEPPPPLEASEKSAPVSLKRDQPKPRPASTSP